MSIMYKLSSTSGSSFEENLANVKATLQNYYSVAKIESNSAYGQKAISGIRSFEVAKTIRTAINQSSNITSQFDLNRFCSVFETRIKNIMKPTLLQDVVVNVAHLVENKIQVNELVLPHDFCQGKTRIFVKSNVKAVLQTSQKPVANRFGTMHAYNLKDQEAYVSFNHFDKIPFALSEIIILDASVLNIPENELSKSLSTILSTTN